MFIGINPYPGLDRYFRIINTSGVAASAKLLRIVCLLFAVSMLTQQAHAQGIPVVGGGSLSYVRPSAPFPCARLTGTIYNFYGYVYFLNGVQYGISTGGTFWHSINCSTLKPDPPETTSFVVPGYQGGACTIAFTIFTAAQTSAVLTCPPVTATPVFLPAAGSYSSSQTISISVSSPGAAIYVTTDGSTPTQQSPRYGGPFTISASETVRAIATLSGTTNSNVASAAYMISLPAAATPVISPAGTTISSPQTVTISDTTPGSTIYLSFDGSTPTTTGIIYTTPLTVTSSEVIKAIAFAPNYVASTVANATFVTNGTGIITPTESPTSTFTNQAATITFTAQLGNDPTLQAGAVSILEYRADGSLVGTLGLMYDDGTHGDVKAGDGIYTAQTSVTNASETPFYFRVSSMHKGSTSATLSDSVEFDVVRRFTQAEIAAMFNVPQQTDQHLETLYAAGVSQSQAQLATVAWLQQQPDVYQAGGDDDGGIWYLLRSGVAGGVLVGATGTRGGPTSASRSPGMISPGGRFGLPFASQAAGVVSTTDTVFNQQAIVLDAFPYVNDESGPISTSLQKSCMSVATGGPILGMLANVATFKTLGQYGVVSIASHGNTWYGGLNWPLTEFPLLKHQVNDNMVGPNLPGSMTSIVPQVIIFTGQSLSAADLLTLLTSSTEYTDDLKQLNLILGFQHGSPIAKVTFAVTPFFISQYDSPHGNQLVYAGSCRSYFIPGDSPNNPGQQTGVPNVTMAQAFVNKGPTYSGTYFGFSEYVPDPFAVKESTALFTALTRTNGTTTGAAFAPLQNDSDTDNEPGRTGPVKFELYGDPNLTLPYCAQRSDELAQFFFADGAPGSLTIYINGVAQQLTGLGPEDTRNLGFNDLPAGSTYTMLVYANGGFADYTINLPPGFAFDNGQASASNRVISFAGPVTYHFHSVANVATSSVSEVSASPASSTR